MIVLDVGTIIAAIAAIYFIHQDLVKIQEEIEEVHEAMRKLEKK